jgi:hypothetical protein
LIFLQQRSSAASLPWVEFAIDIHTTPHARVVSFCPSVGFRYGFDDVCIHKQDARSRHPLVAHLESLPRCIRNKARTETLREMREIILIGMDISTAVRVNIPL